MENAKGALVFKKQKIKKTTGDEDIALNHCIFGFPLKISEMDDYFRMP